MEKMENKWNISKNPINDLKEVHNKIMADNDKVKVFKNVHKLTFEELVVYLQSTKLANTEMEIGCFLCNYGHKAICCFNGRHCSQSYICDLLYEELEKLDNLSTVTEIEEALKPVYLYRKEVERAKMQKNEIQQSVQKKRIKVLEANIVVNGTIERPYYEIKYREVGKTDYSVGYSSFNLINVFTWLKEEFEIVREEQQEKVVQFPVNMDDMQRNVLTELLKARVECTEENLLTAYGCKTIVDALFYLVSERK